MLPLSAWGMVSMDDLDRARHRVETLNTVSRDRAFDCLSGSVVRLFAQFNELQAAYRIERAERVQLAAQVERIAAKLNRADPRHTRQDGEPNRSGGVNSGTRFRAVPQSSE
jgi:hypothetical protein